MLANIIDILKGTTVDGPGFRTSIYFAGCRHQCPGCHNPQSWDFKSGKEYDIDSLMDIITEEDFDVTLSGGDPLYQPHAVRELSRRIREAGHTTWLYTGFTFEEILHNSALLEAVEYIDVIVDSPFIENLKDPDLLFRGSSNQRILDLHLSLQHSRPIPWHRPH